MNYYISAAGDVVYKYQLSEDQKTQASSVMEQLFAGDFDFQKIDRHDGVGERDVLTLYNSFDEYSCSHIWNGLDKLKEVGEIAEGTFECNDDSGEHWRYVFDQAKGVWKEEDGYVVWQDDMDSIERMSHIMTIDCEKVVFGKRVLFVALYDDRKVSKKNAEAFAEDDSLFYDPNFILIPAEQFRCFFPDLAQERE